MRCKFFGLLATLTLFGAVQAHATTVYQFDTPVTGTVAPAGSVDLTVNGSTATFMVSLPVGYSFMQLAFNLNSGATVAAGNYLVSSPSTTYGGIYGPFNTVLMGTQGNELTFTVNNFTGLSDTMVNGKPIWFVAAFVTDADTSGTMAADVTQTQQIQSEPSQTPLPATLPLLAGGAGVLGLLGWRRKRGKPAPRP